MFGYVTPLKSELKFKEFEYFRSYYCGLCNEIKREYGNIPRFCLNYDLTFIGFLLDGLYSTPLNLDSIKCLRHPNKKIIKQCRIKVNRKEAVKWQSLPQ